MEITKFVEKIPNAFDNFGSSEEFVGRNRSFEPVTA